MEQTWRDGGSASSAAQDEPAASERKLSEKLRTSYPKHGMRIKARVLSDLLSHFAKKSDDDPHGDCCEGRIKDRFHFVQKPVKSSQQYKKSLWRRKIMMNEKNTTPHHISELVNEIKSSKFKITADPKVDFNIAHGVSTLSCYDKIPRPIVEHIEDSNSLESSSDLTQKLENVSIECDDYPVSDSVNHSASCMDLGEQTMSKGICTNVQKLQLTVGQSVIDPQSVIDFSSRFREYCTNTINSQLNEKLEKFVAELSRLQRNLYNRDNVKGRFKRRYYAGFKEIERRLQLKKIKFVIIVTDIDKSKSTGNLEEVVHHLIHSCKKYEIAIIFGLTRRKLGYLTHGKGSVSCIGVANYEALEDKLEEALKKVIEARNDFKIRKGESEQTIDISKISTDDLLLSERVKVLLRTLAIN